MGDTRQGGDHPQQSLIGCYTFTLTANKGLLWSVPGWALKSRLNSYSPFKGNLTVDEAPDEDEFDTPAIKY